MNLNCGCPSERVQSGSFGACLMGEPERVAQCVAAMIAAVPPHVVVSVKCRLGIDDQDTDKDLERFVGLVSSAGCRKFIVHARKAWLKGLNPKENRNIPPLDYGRVHRLKREHPELEIMINGGICRLEDGLEHITKHGMDGVMFGRAVMDNPWVLRDVDALYYGAVGGPLAESPEQVILGMRPYVERHLAEGGTLHEVTRRMAEVYTGHPGARKFRRFLGEATCGAAKNKAGFQVLVQAMEMMKAFARERAEEDARWQEQQQKAKEQEKGEVCLN